MRLSSIRWGYFALLALAAAGGAEAESRGDIPLRVAVIYNIVQFVQWPEEGGTGAEVDRWEVAVFDPAFQLVGIDARR